MKITKKYKLGPRRRRKELIDTFAAIYPHNKTHECYILEDELIPEALATDRRIENKTEKEEELRCMMDHDPVKITFTLVNCN